MANNTIKATQAKKAGQWVLPLDVDGKTVYALQINKTKSDKADFDNIAKEYIEKGIEIFTYEGKNDNPVYLVRAEEKLTFRQPSVKEEKLVAILMKNGLSEKDARKAYHEAK